jgi:threonine aldolase
MHLDGARGLNAAQSLKVTPSTMVSDFDTVNFCLSKGMGCPVGSMVIGSKEDIEHARVLRKMLGGQMRQVGILAICGLISLEDWQERLQNDHDNARWIANEMAEKISYVTGIGNIDLIDTNIFRFSLKPDYMKLKKIDHTGFCDLLRQNNILINPSFVNDAIRVVTHRDVSRQQLEQFFKTLKALA